LPKIKKRQFVANAVIRGMADKKLQFQDTISTDQIANGDAASLCAKAIQVEKIRFQRLTELLEIIETLKDAETLCEHAFWRYRKVLENPRSKPFEEAVAHVVLERAFCRVQTVEQYRLKAEQTVVQSLRQQPWETEAATRSVSESPVLQFIRSQVTELLWRPQVIELRWRLEFESAAAGPVKNTSPLFNIPEESEVDPVASAVASAAACDS
jgi:hypothetical protein